MSRLTESVLLRPLRAQNFRRVWLGELVATIGAAFQTVLSAVLVLQLSSSGLALGIALLIGGLPRMVFTLLGGSMGDRLSPRLVMLASYVCRAAILCGLGFVAVSGELQLWHVYLARLLYGLADAVFIPSVSAIIPRVVGKDQLQAANSLHRTVLGAGVVGGNVVAGILIAFTGTNISMFLIAAAFTLAAITLSRVTLAPLEKTPGTKVRTGILHSVADGARYLWRGRTTRVVLLLTAALTLFVAGPVNVGIPALGQLRFASPTALGTMFAAYGVGTIAGSLLPGILGHRIRRVGVLLAALGCLFGGCVVLLGLASTPLLASLAAIPMGACGAMFNVVALSIVQTETDPAYMGRVMSWYSVSGYGVNPLSNVLTGVLADLSLTTMFVLCGAIAMVISGAAFAVPALTRLSSAAADAPQRTDAGSLDDPHRAKNVKV